MSNNCGISRWDDPSEINARLKKLTSQPIWEVDDEYYNGEIINSPSSASGVSRGLPDAFLFR